MAEIKLVCPYSQRECVKNGSGVLVEGKIETHACPKWINIIGKEPQTGQNINQWNCSDAWVPILLIENSKMQHETAASVDMFRESMLQANEVSRELLLANSDTIKKLC